jgi:hypothetical protein
MNPDIVALQTFLATARSVSRHEYLLDEYKAPRVSLSRITGDPFACPKDAELFKSPLAIEIGPGSNVFRE